jgi:hypothetical protein
LKIGLIGYGYWGNIIHRCLHRNGFKLDFIFTTKSVDDLTEYFNSGPLVHCKVQPYAQLYNTALDFLFIASGPQHSIAIIKNLARNGSLESLNVWSEKPFYIDSTIHFTDLDLQTVFVDYLYTLANASSGFHHMVEYISSSLMSRDAVLLFEVYSQRKYTRLHSIHSDFMAHFFSLLASITPIHLDHSLLLYEGIHSCGQNTYEASFKINKLNAIFRYGTSKKNTNRVYYSDNYQNFDMPLSICFPHPLDKNILRFMSGKRKCPYSPYYDHQLHHVIGFYIEKLCLF